MNKAWVIIPAAGIGSRMQADIPKQYLTLSGKTILERTLSRFIGLNWVHQILVALHPADAHFEQLPETVLSSVRKVIGGDSRRDSVYNALKAIEPEADDLDWVIVHDAARACVLSEQLDVFFEKASESDNGAIMAMPMADTLKFEDQTGIKSTPDRSHFWRAQTPQQFRYGDLKSALMQFDNVTDEASAIEQLGLDYQFIEGNNFNIKITRPDDLAFAEAVLSIQDNNKRENDV